MAKKKDPTNEPSSPIDADIQALGYEDAVEKLEELVESIERGDVGLEQSLASYRRGEMLLRHCRALLDKADLSVREMTLADAENGGTN